MQMCTDSLVRNLSLRGAISNASSVIERFTKAGTEAGMEQEVL